MAPNVKLMQGNNVTAKTTDSGYSTPTDEYCKEVSLEEENPKTTGNITDTAVHTVEDEDPVTLEAKWIAEDVLDSEYPIGGHNGNVTWPFRARHRSQRTVTVLRVVDQLLQKHEILYKSMVTRLNLTNHSNVKYLNVMCNEVFGDGKVTWGRIVALYALCVQIARHFKQEGVDRNAASESINHIGRYIGEKLADWIRQEGGWAAMEVACPPDDHMERAIWKGLMWTGCGLSFLATVINCVR